MTSEEETPEEREDRIILSDLYGDHPQISPSAYRRPPLALRGRSELEEQERILAEDSWDIPRTASRPIPRTLTANNGVGNAEESTPDREMVLREGRAEDAEIPASQMVFHNPNELVAPYDPSMIITLHLPTCRYCNGTKFGITIDGSTSGVEGGVHICGECLIKGLDFLFGKKKIEEEEKMMEITDIELDSGEIFDGIMEDLTDE